MRRHILLYSLAIMMSVSSIAHGSELKDFAGTWAMRLGDRNLFVLTLTRQGKSIVGAWDEPAEYSSHNGAFSNIRGGVRHKQVPRANFVDGVLHLTVQDGNDPKDTEAYLMMVNGDRASLTDDNPSGGVVGSSMQFEHVIPGASVALDWEPNRLYTTNDFDSPSEEMKMIFAEDQRVRMTDKVDWRTVNKTDEERRNQTRQLLAAGALHTGKDYEEAAFVFQHGTMAEDYLLAHTLAMVAVSKGDSKAIWVAAATLDRYLEKIGQKQVFGTQFSKDSQHNWTQEPYDRNLVSDALRQQLAVPTQNLQGEQLKSFQKQN